MRAIALSSSGRSRRCSASARSRRSCERNFPKAGRAPQDRVVWFRGRALAQAVSILNSQPLNPRRLLRFCYSYFALYGDPLLEKHADPYPEGLLARLAQAGVNGVWLQAVLHKLAPFPWLPERSARYQERLKNLRALVARANKHGIRVFLYLNEPRAMPLSFFRPARNSRARREGDHAALCTSVPEVQELPREFGRHDLPRRAGPRRVLQHHAPRRTSPIAGRITVAPNARAAASVPPADVIAEVNRLFQDGIRKAGARAQLIAWDWGWNDAWAGDVIRQLPAEVALQSVSEWSLPIERGGVKSEVGEYSISSIGPGPRAQRHWKIARDAG